MNSLATPIMLTLATGLAAAAPHTSTIEINNGRASLVGFSEPNTLLFHLDMASDTPSPATGEYSISMPDAGTPCEVYLDGGFTLDFNSDNIADAQFEFAPIMVDNTFVSDGFRTAWSSPYTVAIDDLELDLSPFGFGFAVALSDISLTLLGGDVDNSAPAGDLGANAFMDFEFRANLSVPGLPTELPAPDLVGPDGFFSIRYDTHLRFTLIPAPATLVLLPLAAAASTRRRRANA